MIGRHILKLIAGLGLVTACTDASLDPSALPDPSFAKGGRPFEPGEQQPVADWTRAVYAIYPTGVGQNLQQTFTPSSNQWLGYLELPVACSEDVLLNVKIRDGFNGAILYEANYAGLTGGVGVFELLQVYDPAVSHHGIRLRRGQEYAFELAAFPAEGAEFNSCGIVVGPVGNSYAGGRAYYQDPINGPDFIPIPTGQPTDDEDLPFITLVR